MAKKKIDVASTGGFETRHDPKEDGPKAPADGTGLYHAVRRRGFWYVERTPSSESPIYFQLGVIPRDVEGHFFGQSRVLAFDDEAAQDIAQAIGRGMLRWYKKQKAGAKSPRAPRTATKAAKKGTRKKS